jgi:hypothetical protein
MGLFLSVTTAYPKINIGILSANIGILKIPNLQAKSIVYNSL